jgi:hypothetical protein
MHYLAAVFLFPLLLWALSLGCGLLIGRLTGARLPALLLLPIGFGTLIAVSQFTTWWKPTAPLTPAVLAVLAVLGFVLARVELRERWTRRPRGWWWLPVPALGAYAVLAAPLIVAGRPTFTGYLLDTTGAVQIAGAERLLHHAHNFGSNIPAYGTTLQAYFGNGYPSGGHGVLAAVGWLSGQSLIWLFTGFQALSMSMLALVLAFIARRAGLGRGAAALAGIVGAVPALDCAYLLMGSIKEVTALPMLVLMGALLICARELRIRAGLRAVLPFAVAAAAALGSIGIAASPWVAAFGACTLLWAVPVSSRRDLRPLLIGGVGLAAATALVALPTTASLSQRLTLAESVSNSNAAAAADPGNLLRPLKFLQTLGVWLGESHRVDPRYIQETYVLMGVMLVGLALGLVWLVRRRAWGVLAFVAISFLVWEVVHRHGTEWTNAKLLVILSPVLVFVAITGALGLMQGRTLEGLLLTAAIVVGVLGSDALLYHGTNLAPTQRYEELANIGERFAAQGPTLATDFDEYDLYLLRKMEVDSPGLAYSQHFTLLPGVPQLYGHSYDPDTISLPSIEAFKTIVMRRSPAWSRPPGNFVREHEGRSYSVWRRTGSAPLAHIGLGGGYEPALVLPCRRIGHIAAEARSKGARISFAPRASNISVDLAKVYRSPLVVPSVDLEGRPQLGFAGPGRIEGGLYARKAGSYELWLGGDIDRAVDVYVDGRLVGSPAQQTGDDGTMIDVGRVTLAAGKHVVRLMRYGGDLNPDDDGSSAIDGLVFEPRSNFEAPVKTIAPSAWRTLCGQSLDWIELSRAG